MQTLTYNHEKEIALKKLKEQQHRQAMQETTTAQSAPATKPGSKLKKTLKIIIGTIFILTAIIAGIYVCKKNTYGQNVSIAMTFMAGLAITMIQYKVRVEHQIQAKIMQDSEQYRELLALNNEILTRRPELDVRSNNCRYQIHNGVVVIQAYHRCRSKRQFDSLNITKVVRNYIDQDHDYFVKWLMIKSAENALSTQYHQKINKIQNMSDYDRMPKEDQEKITPEKYKEYVQKLIQTNQLEFITSIRFKIKYSYTSPQGRNHYSDHAIFYEDDIRSFLKISKPDETIPNSRSSYGTACVSEAFKQRQRSLMTNKMRYKILQRDDHRCVLCGRTAQESIAASGYGLEVDHIIPVSKGGKTVESNLRTLCFACNRGKGADIEKNTA